MTLNSLPNGLLPRSSSEPVKSEQYVVQKFGGTSVGRFATQIIEDVIKASLKSEKVAVVCSALSTTVKTEGTTNRLLLASRKAQTPESQDFRVPIEKVRAQHMSFAQQKVKNPAIQARLLNYIEEECALVVRILEASQTLGETSPRSRDKIISTGEKLSCRLIEAMLQDQAIDSDYVDLSEILDFEATDGRLDQPFWDRVVRNIARRLAECGERVPVITGYFGPVTGGLLEKVGRGYTDLCAALVAVALSAQELQIWKEVDGIFTADPRKVPTAKLLPQITPAEASELTFYGSEVIHPFTMEQVIRAEIPIRIKNVTKTRCDGTRVFPDSPQEVSILSTGHHSKLFRTRSTALLSGLKGPKRPTAVTTKNKILVINVHSNKRSLSHGFFAKIFSTLDKWRLSIDLISTSEVHVSMALHSEAPLYDGDGEDEYRIINKDLECAVEELRAFGTVDMRADMAIVSLIGKQMKNMVGIAGKMFATLGENNVNIEMISQGASEINISCVISQRDADRAINILHTNLFTFLDV